jgi:hypothetical protein
MTDDVVTLRGSAIPGHPANALSRARRWGAIPAFGTRMVGPSEFYAHAAPFGAMTSGFVATPAGHLKCRPLIVAYDDDGVDFPSDVVQVISGESGTNSDQAITVSSLTSGASVTLASRRHWLHIVVELSGIPEATTGTITLVRPDDWKRLGFAPGDTTLETIPFDGANGRHQRFAMAPVYSAPAASNGYIIGSSSSAYGDTGLRASFALGVQFTWSGTAPSSAYITYNPRHIYYSPVVPTGAVPADFTARPDTDWQHLWEPFSHTPGWTRPWRFVPKCPKGNWAFSRDSTNVLNDSSGDTADPTQTSLPSQFNAMGRMHMGVPWWVLDRRLAAKTGEWLYRGMPNIWIGNELKRLLYTPNSLGYSLSSYVLMTVTAGDGIGVPTVTTAWTAVGAGAGWRNIRIRTVQNQLNPGSTLDAWDIEFRINGGASLGINSLMGTTYTATEGGILDLGPVLPPARDVDALLEVRVTLTIGGGISGFGIFAAHCSASPRVDIPIPTTCLGADGLEAPGGYLASDITDPTPLGGTLHNGASVSSVSWSPGSGSRQHFAVISFLPPTTGLWRITSPAALNVTLGEYLFCGANGFTGARIGRANKRFFGALRASGASLNGTWALAAVTRTPKTIVAAGTAIAAADLSPVTFGYLFGEIAIPDAGTWNVWAKVTIGSNSDSHRHTVEVAISTTDPYVTDDILASAHREAEVHLGNRIATWTSLATPPGSPSLTTVYWIIATATGAWAGREGQAAIWNAPDGWHFFTPGAGPVYATLDGVASYWDGEAWQPTTDKVINLTVTTDGPTTVYVRANYWDPYVTTPSNTSPLFSGGGLTIGWDAV